MPNKHLTYLVADSYGRCSMRTEFYDDFYKTFADSSDKIVPLFENTDMAMQKKFLREGISMMILYARNNFAGKSALQRIAKIHDKFHLNIHPDLYSFWLDCLLENIEKHDHEFTSETGRAWKVVMEYGIKFFTTHYYSP